MSRREVACGSGKRKGVLSVLAIGLLAISLTGLQSCSSTARPNESKPVADVPIAGMVIRNELLYPVTDVMISVPATGAFAGCGNVMPRSECSTSFEARPYTANKLIIQWKEHGQTHTTGEFAVERPAEIEPGQETWLEVVIFAMGQAGARLVQR